MNKGRKIVVAIIVAALGMGLWTATAGTAVAAKPPLKVRILTPDGKQRLKVKRKLVFLVGCTKNCAVKVKMKLVMPSGTLKASVKGGIKAFSAKAPMMRLNRPALNYLKLSYPRSRLVVKVTARDVATGKRVVKRKVFRFHR